MRTLRIFSLILVTAFALGCNKDASTPEDGSSTGTIQKPIDGTDPTTTGGTTTDKGKSPEGSTGTTSVSPPNSTGVTTPNGNNTPKVEPIPTKSSYVGEYKLSVGKGEKWQMYMLTMWDSGSCELKHMSGGAKADAMNKEGKWTEQGGKAIVEWKGESPMVLVLNAKDNEMTVEQFDKSKWPNKLLVFYKKATAGPGGAGRP